MIHWLGYILIFIFICAFVLMVKSEEESGWSKVISVVCQLATLFYIIATEVGMR